MDFVLYGEKGLFAFEAKRTGRVSSSMLKGLKSFIEDYPMAKAYYIYGGKRRMHEENIEILPINAFLKKLPELLA